MKLNVKYQSAALNQDRIDIVCVLLMKIRGYFEMQAFNVRKEQTVRSVGTLNDFIKDVSYLQQKSAYHSSLSLII